VDFCHILQEYGIGVGNNNSARNDDIGLALQTAPTYLDSVLFISSPQFLDEAKTSTQNIGIRHGAIAQELKCEVVRLSGGLQAYLWSQQTKHAIGGDYQVFHSSIFSPNVLLPLPASRVDS
jgi:hypothetical protein